MLTLGGLSTSSSSITERGSRAELHAFGERIGGLIRADIEAIHAGATVGQRAGNRRWIFREEQAFEREYYLPSTGLVVSFEGAWSALPTPDLTTRLSDA